MPLRKGDLGALRRVFDGEILCDPHPIAGEVFHPTAAHVAAPVSMSVAPTPGLSESASSARSRSAGRYDRAGRRWFWDDKRGRPAGRAGPPRVLWFANCNRTVRNDAEFI